MARQEVTGRAPVERKGFRISEFCAAHGFSRATYYNLRKAGKGPREKRVLNCVIITDEAAQEWRLAQDPAGS